MNNKNNETKILRVIDEFMDLGISFFKAQLIFFLINTAVIGAGLLILGFRFWAIIIALGIALFDILPILGSGFIFVPWIIYSVHTGNKSLALGLGILFVVTAALRIIVEPLIIGKKIKLSPLITVAAAALGIFAFGVVGIVAGPVLAAAGMTVYRVWNLKK